jgi:hypothetical protein
VERLARDKYSSLILKSVNYVCKKFFSTGPKVIKLLTAVIYEFSNKARAFVRPGLKSLPGTNPPTYYKNS